MGKRRYCISGKLISGRKVCVCEKERAFTYISMHNILSSLQQDNETKSELKYI